MYAQQVRSMLANTPRGEQLNYREGLGGIPMVPQGGSANWNANNPQALSDSSPWNVGNPRAFSSGRQPWGWGNPVAMSNAPLRGAPTGWNRLASPQSWGPNSPWNTGNPKGVASGTPPWMQSPFAIGSKQDAVNGPGEHDFYNDPEYEPPNIGNPNFGNPSSVSRGDDPNRMTFNDEFGTRNTNFFDRGNAANNPFLNLNFGGNPSTTNPYGGPNTYIPTYFDPQGFPFAVPAGPDVNLLGGSRHMGVRHNQ